MSREQSEVLSVVTSEMDNRENKFLKWLLAGLLTMVLAITGAAFILGAKIQDAQNKLNTLIKSHEVVIAETATRVQEWSVWRKDVDSAIDVRLQNRFTATDYEWTKSIFNMSNPPVRLPDFSAVKRAQQ